jgi:DNA polymerase III sliding clamp (beta) subunit (PCNA family)
MKAKLDGKVLLDALDLVGAGFSPTTLTRVMVNTGDDGLGHWRIDMWDTEATASILVPYGGEKNTDLSVIMPSVQLETLLSKTRTKEFEIQGKENSFVLKANNSRLSIPKVDESVTSNWNVDDNYPIQIEIAKGGLLGSIAGPIEDILGTYANIRGIQVSASNGEVTILATDGFRIYRSVIKDAGLIKANNITGILSLKILKFFKDLDGSELPVGIGLKDTSYLIRAGVGDLTLAVNGCSIIGKFPDVSSRFASKPDNRFIISASKLKKEVDLHQSLSQDKVPAGIFEFTETGISIETKGNKQVSNSHIDLGEEYEILERTGDIKIAIRLKYLLDAIKFISALDCEKIEIGIATKTTGLIWIQPAEETRLLHPEMDVISLVAPVNV